MSIGASVVVPTAGAGASDATTDSLALDVEGVAAGSGGASTATPQAETVTGAVTPGAGSRDSPSEGGGVCTGAEEDSHPGATAGASARGMGAAAAGKASLRSSCRLARAASIAVSSLCSESSHENTRLLLPAGISRVAQKLRAPSAFGIRTLSLYFSGLGLQVRSSFRLCGFEGSSRAGKGMRSTSLQSTLSTAAGPQLFSGAEETDMRDHRAGEHGGVAQVTDPAPGRNARNRPAPAMNIYGMRYAAQRRRGAPPTAAPRESLERLMAHPPKAGQLGCKAEGGVGGEAWERRLMPQATRRCRCV
eukprot:scaffold3082_cov119-Isochrysis_galbana.AAC.8